MNHPEALELLHRVRAMSQHETAHWLIATALGFVAQGIRLEVESMSAHRGKADTILDARCETLQEMQVVIRKRILIKLAGAMGEALNRETNLIDAKAAHDILEEGDTGAVQDYAVARELTVLLHNSLPVREGFTSRDLLVQLLGEAFNLVSLHAMAVCDLADVLSARVVAGKGKGDVRKEEIHQIPLYCQVPYPWGQSAQ